MGRHKHLGKPHKRDKAQFVAIPYSMIRNPSYQALSIDARCILIQMHLGFHGHNNGEIGFSIRQAMECLGSGSYREKEHWINCKSLSLSCTTLNQALT